MLKKTLFFSNKTSITTKNEQLVINSEIRNATIPIEDIGFVVMEHPEIYVSIPTLTKLTENNVAVIFCDAKHMPCSMLLNLDNHHIQHELFANQINATEPVSYTHLRAHETDSYLVCRLLLEKKKTNKQTLSLKHT